MATTTTNPEATFICTLGDDALLFRRMQGSEELGRLSEYRLELLRPSKLPKFKAEQLLGTSATVKLLLTNGQHRFINGWITAVELGGAIGRFDIYRLEMRPWLYHLTLGADCRIFQDMTAVDIIKKVFGDYGNAQFEVKVTGAQRTRQYCVQYRESDFDFVSRLMEEEGIFYYFKHENGKHTMLLCKGSTGPVPLVVPKLAWSVVQTGGQLREDIIRQWRLTQQVGSLKFTHDDYDHEAPSTKLEKSTSRTAKYSSPGDLEVYDWPGKYAFPGDAAKNATEGQGGARLEVDRYETAHIVATAETPCRSVGAGMTFGFTDHPDKADYLITAVNFTFDRGDHEATEQSMGTGFSAHLRLVPKAVPYASPAFTPRAIVRGPQTAVVVGPAGEEIHVDKFGRIKVQFRWDRVGKKDADSSCWIRVATPWSSKGFGMISIPRMGDEVVVDFMEGDPDRPLIIGSVYNAENMPPYALPGQKTVAGIRSRSTLSGGATNFNELRFDDKKGSEYVWLQAEKDFHRLVKNDATDEIGRDNQLEIARDHKGSIGRSYDMSVGKTATIKVATDVHVDVGGDTSISTGAAYGLTVGSDLEMTAGGSAAINAGNTMDINSGAAMQISAGATLHVKAGAGMIIDAGPMLALKAGAGIVILGPDGVSIVGPMIKMNSGGSSGPAKKAKKAAPKKPSAAAKTVQKKDPLGG